MESMYDWVQKMIRLEKSDAPTKEEFGRIMHDDSIPEEKKLEVLKQVELAGGYEGLCD